MSNDTQVLRATLETALARIEDMLADDDGQAFKEARKFLESARQLAEQPVKRCPYCDDTGDVHSIDGEWRGTCNCPAARPLTAPPTDPSTEASEPVGEREAFEAWFEGERMPAESDWFRREPADPDEYFYASTDDSWRAWQAARTTPPPAPVLSDANHELIKVAAWLLSPEPRRKLAELEDATHIGHRQFHRAYEGTFETLRLKAMEIRSFVDAGRASRGAK